ncbi:MAG: 40S ribosomal protein S3a/S1 [Thermoprotei archaeon]
MSASKLQKTWISVKAPPSFNQVDLPRILTQTNEAVLNRRITVSLSDLTGDIRQLHVFLKFRVIEVNGGIAKTRFDQLELAREYVRGMVRRGTTKTEAITDVETRDGARLRVFTIIISKGKVHRSKRTAVRKTTDHILTDKATNNSFDGFVQEIVQGKASAEIFTAARKIVSVNALEIRKVKVISPPNPEQPIQGAVETKQ